MANILPDSAGRNNQIAKVNAAGTAYETVPPAVSALGVRGTDNRFPDFDFISNADYTLPAGATFLTNLYGPGRRMLQLGSNGTVYASNIDVYSPAFPVGAGAQLWYGGMYGTYGTDSAAARVFVQFLDSASAQLALVELPESTITTTRTQIVGKGIIAPAETRTARFLFRRSGNASATNAAVFSSFEVLNFKSLNREVTYCIPTDYPTLQAAVDALKPTVGVLPGKRIILLIQSGHQLTAGMAVTRGDYSYFEIQSEVWNAFDWSKWDRALVGSEGSPERAADVALKKTQRDGTTLPVVTLAAGFQGVSALSYFADDGADSDASKTSDENENLILGWHSKMPVLGCLIDMGWAYDNGYYGSQACEGYIRPRCGVVRAGHDAVAFRGGKCWANEAILREANNHAIRAAFNAEVTFQQAYFPFCGHEPDENGRAVIDVSRTSKGHGKLCDFRYFGKLRGSPLENANTSLKATGFNCRRNSILNLEEADGSGGRGSSNANTPFGGGHFQHSSFGSCFGLWLNNISEGYPMRFSTGGHANMNGAQFKVHAGTYAVFFDEGGRVTATACQGNSGVLAVGEINLGALNAWTPDGCFEDNAAANPLSRLGEYSAGGDKDGFTFTNGALQISRDTTATEYAVEIAGPSGKGGIRTQNATLMFMLDEANNVFIATRNGSPENSTIGGQGSIILRKDGGATSTLYVKTSGGNSNTGWTAK